MKKKFLFPILFVILFGLLIQTGLADVLFVLLAPVNLLILAIEVNSGALPNTLTGDGTYSLILVGIIQFFLVGCVWDLIAKYFKNRTYNGE